MNRIRRNTYFTPFDYRVGDFIWGYKFARRLGRAHPTDVNLDSGLPRLASVRSAWRNFAYRAPQLRRNDRVKYG